MSEENFCHEMLRLIRVRYEAEAKPWVDRLVRIKQSEMPSFIIEANKMTDIRLQEALARSDMSGQEIKP